MMTTRQTLEAALVANPDDRALHAAYADLLLEEGDPRGEYVRLALLVEDRNQPVSQLANLEQAMFDLRLRYESQWLGPLAPFLERRQARSVAEPLEPNVSVAWRRGWMDSLRIGQLSQPLILAVADCPLTRILGELSIEQNRPEPPNVTALALRGEPAMFHFSPDQLGSHLDLTPLVKADRFRNLRVFKLGSFAEGILASGWELDEYLANATQLEEVRICSDQFSAAFLFGGEFPRLHTLHLSGTIDRLPFSLLGSNHKIPNLRHLFLDTETYHPADEEGDGRRRELNETDFLCLHQSECLPSLETFTLRDASVGDDGLRLILEAPFFRRLKGLDLSRCSITDDGAQLLANHPHTRNLEFLRLDYNYLSPVGADVLEAIGVTVGDQLFGPPVRHAWDARDEDQDWDEQLDDFEEDEFDDNADDTDPDEEFDDPPPAGVAQP